MLFLLFQLGTDRYVLEASRVVEVLPLLEIRSIPQAPKGVAGVFNYRGRPVPAIDLSELTLGRPARRLLSTRIILVNYESDAGSPGGQPGQQRLVGLIAEGATRMIRKEKKDFVDSGMKFGHAPYLGPIIMDEGGVIQLIYEQKLLPPPVREILFGQIQAQAP